jgi:CrcB protein
MTWVMVAVGGAAGSLARYGVAFSISRWVGNPVPIATALVNVVGCAVAGILLGLTASQRLLLTAEQPSLLLSAVLGGLTTMSGFGIDTQVLVQEGRGATAVINVVAQVIVGLAVLALAFAVARR